MKPTEFLKQQWEKNPGVWTIGEVLIHPDGTMNHCADSLENKSLRLLSLEELTEWIKKNDQGEFRPLHAAPNLPRGWKTSALNFDERVLALRVLYPNSVSHWTQWKEKTLRVTPYLETAERQTGMYHCTRLLTPDQLSELVQGACAKACLKRRLWEPQDTVDEREREIPLICSEACNFLIAQAREVVKRNNPRKP